jgi:hypothetical protein
VEGKRFLFNNKDAKTQRKYLKAHNILLKNAPGAMALFMTLGARVAYRNGWVVRKRRRRCALPAQSIDHPYGDNQSI